MTLVLGSSTTISTLLAALTTAVTAGLLVSTPVLFSPENKPGQLKATVSCSTKRKADSTLSETSAQRGFSNNNDPLGDPLWAFLISAHLLDSCNEIRCGGVEDSTSGLNWMAPHRGWAQEGLEAFFSSALSMMPDFIYQGFAKVGAHIMGSSQKQDLIQLDAIVHKPTGYASSPSLPGTINSPWWTDFSHLIYWFYFISTFVTVTFLWYLYDFKVRRVETSHPIRETRGFSRAQTGDLVTAVLPLTWSATMVMHASTHSINFDENTAGAAFSFTVVAYQWGWNYYFPRDIVAKIEAAPKVVGRGRIVFFEASPLETLLETHLDSWALRATTGSRHGSRSGRLNSPTALSLILPTDVPTGLFSRLAASPQSSSWRKALVAALSEINNPPLTANLPEPGKDTLFAPNLGLETPTVFRSKPTAHMSGARLGLIYDHLAPRARFGLPSFSSTSWVTANFYLPEGGDAQIRGPRALLAVPENCSSPSLENLSGVFRPSLAPNLTGILNLDYLQGPRSLLTQHLLWTGPDAVTGAVNTSLGSTEDHGWVSPVTASESSLRSALGVRAEVASFLRPNSFKPASVGVVGGAFLMPFDLNARLLLSHSARGGTPLPFTWALASAALESEIDSASLDIWVNSLFPDLSYTALTQPVTLVTRQDTPRALSLLLTPLAGGIRSFSLTPLSQGALPLYTRELANPALSNYLARPTAIQLPSLQVTEGRRGKGGAPSQLGGLAVDTFKAKTVKAVAARAIRLSLSKQRADIVAHLTPRASLAKSQLLYLETRAPSMHRKLPKPLPLGGSLGLNPRSTNRVRFVPSSAGLGLDEARLIRTGASKLIDVSMVSNKLEGLATPSLIIPSKPLMALGLGWSTSASLSAYPSYKISRGGVHRRPFTGLYTQERPLGGLKDPFNPLNFSKNLSYVGLPLLTLAKPSVLQFHISGPSLDTQAGHWSKVWATLLPAPTEDLDPTFINSIWTPEVNTTRRSDHNARYLVSWSPLLSSITAKSAFNPALSGPGVRSTHSPLSIRSSVFALNELGLKNSFGVHGAKPFLIQSETPGSYTYVSKIAPSTAITPSAPSLRWASLWGSLPYPATNPFVNSATQFTPASLGGRSTAVLTNKGSLLRGVASSGSSHIGGGDKINPLADILARLDFSVLRDSALEIRPRQGYIPLSSDISVSRRLRVTKGITLPSDIPMHVICGSKDVIHSWAIPGLNIKIDCIPGYNSHRRLLLRWRGAYWGQCMEVCGRYHHWMPIMVNVSHPALFVDWCLAFLRGLDSQSANGPSTLASLNLESLLESLGSSK